MWRCGPRCVCGTCNGGGGEIAGSRRTDGRTQASPRGKVGGRSATRVAAAGYSEAEAVGHELAAGSGNTVLRRLLCRWALAGAGSCSVLARRKGSVYLVPEQGQEQGQEQRREEDSRPGHAGSRIRGGRRAVASEVLVNSRFGFGG